MEYLGDRRNFSKNFHMVADYRRMSPFGSLISHGSGSTPLTIPVFGDKAKAR